MPELLRLIRLARDYGAAILCLISLGLFGSVGLIGERKRIGDHLYLTDLVWIRLRSLFVPTVSVEAILHARDASSPDDAIEQLYSWERDRLMTLAKGESAAAITVLTGLIAAAVEGKVTTEPVILYLAGALVGVLLLWAAFILTGLRRLAEEYSLALSIVNE